MKTIPLALLLFVASFFASPPQEPMKPNQPIASPSQVPVPFLWFEGRAEEAARFYCSIFPDSKIEHASSQVVTFRLHGQRFMALNGGPHYRLSPAYSMFVPCKDQAEVDRLWDALLAGGGHPDQCGWMVDRFGLSWQVVPTRLVDLLTHQDAAIRERTMNAMLPMQKIDLAAIERAVATK